MQISRHVNLLFQNVNSDCFDFTLRDPIADPLICRPAGYRARPKLELSCETHSRLLDINIEFDIVV